jgi:hypothetical protein
MRKFKVLKLDVKNDLTYMIPPKEDEKFLNMMQTEDQAQK